MNTNRHALRLAATHCAGDGSESAGLRHSRNYFAGRVWHILTEPTADELLAGILRQQDNNSNLVDHARRELEISGLFRKDSDYGGMIGHATLDLVRLFARQGHSGMSAMWVAELCEKLFRYQTISPNDHSEYVDVSEYCGGTPMLQCKRDSRWFSEDGGANWYNVEEKS